MLECLKKTFLKPYESVDDIRLTWLDEILQYFKSWKEYIETRNDANYRENTKRKIFISWQSYEGLQINVPSFREVCKFLLQQRIPFILLERFCQDDLVRMLLVVDLIIQLYMILDIMATQLRINFQLDPLKEMCKVLQKNLRKYVMNLCRNEENERSLKKLIVALAVGRVRDYWL